MHYLARPPVNSFSGAPLFSPSNTSSIGYQSAPLSSLGRIAQPLDNISVNTQFSRTQHLLYVQVHSARPHVNNGVNARRLDLIGIKQIDITTTTFHLHHARTSISTSPPTHFTSTHSISSYAAFPPRAAATRASDPEL